MPEQIIEDYINEFLTGMHKKNALEFVSYLKANDMLFEKSGGYWEDKLYWGIKYKNEYVCNILIGSEEKPGSGPWKFWSDDSGSNCYDDVTLEDHLKEIAWKHIGICGKCGGCSTGAGTQKTIFGKEFNNVCLTNMSFADPNNDELECLKKIVETRKNYILRDTQST
jgi:hypothetical protein